MSLNILPDEILLIIFNYCNVQDLIKLRGVCKRFYDITSEFLIKESNNLLVTGQKSEKFRERCQPLLSSYIKKFYIYNNWKYGRYKDKIFYPKHVSSSFQHFNNEVYTHRLQMTRDMILLAYNMQFTAANLCAFNRTKNGLVSDDNVIVAKCSTQILDIFVPRNDIIVTLHGDGSIRQWTIKSLDGRKYFNEKLLRSSCSNLYIIPSIIRYINCYFMDVTPQSIITAADTGEIEVWKYMPEENSIKDKYVIPNLNLNCTLEPYMYFITFDPTGTKFAAEISHGIEDDTRFIIYDINKCCTEIHIKGKDFDSKLYYVKQVLWIEPNYILKLFGDKVIKIDARTHKVVQKWNAPFEYYDNDCDEKWTCMSTDYQYAIMTGTFCGEVILWDQRKSDLIRVYNYNNVDTVNCLQFDSSHMYVAGNYEISEFDFTKL